MKKIGRFALAGMIALVLAAPVCADGPAANTVQVQEDAGPATVPPAQLELIKKREEAKKRRDELLKERAAAVQKSGGSPPPAAGQ